MLGLYRSNYKYINVGSYALFRNEMRSKMLTDKTEVLKEYVEKMFERDYVSFKIHPTKAIAEKLIAEKHFLKVTN